MCAPSFSDNHHQFLLNKTCAITTTTATTTHDNDFDHYLYRYRYRYATTRQLTQNGSALNVQADVYWTPLPSLRWACWPRQSHCSHGPGQVEFPNSGSSSLSPRLHTRSEVSSVAKSPQAREPGGGLHNGHSCLLSSGSSSNTKILVTKRRASLDILDFSVFPQGARCF